MEQFRGDRDDRAASDPEADPAVRLRFGTDSGFPRPDAGNGPGIGVGTGPGDGAGLRCFSSDVDRLAP
jgi:hypothetical protein